ncbi:hypothetical protein NZNM25_01560 [Nitrosopumilus zosterae]|uniref:Uncharacterized protein n=1 Tax=Nitrosopumilus zosterae TaxID=718286 RepID=A0A2S2KPE7_9ARCH|nr:hypothetical protein [Nitrosopumilus zosterae]BDQ31152.1 hypothetical protein NZOSNM25_001263 [Nitrosopumilus zosterae]GBH33365.1 hypothetical protein NZNM25_01560 [Nitrosopumilus zosterae]
MSKWIHAKFSLDGSNRLISADRKTWFININQKYFKNMVSELVIKFTDLVCKVCMKSHHTQSGLISCLWFHRHDSIDYYLDNIMDDKNE